MNNEVELIHHFGDDLMVVNAARVSYGKTKASFDDKDKKLIKYLIEHKHLSPFRHPQLQFRIKCPIFVERQLFKSQVGLTANSISGRYVDFSDEYWTPERLRYQSENSKQGSAGDLPVEENTYFSQKIANHIKNSQDLYEEMCNARVAKEQARIILPLCLHTQFIWTGSLAAFIHLWNLRLKPDAQQETREVAQIMLNEVQRIDGSPFKYTLESFGF